MIPDDKNNLVYFNESINIATQTFNIIYNMGGYVPHNHSHILYIIREAMGDSCKTYLEIGVGYGCSMSISLNSKYKCKHIGIDMFETISPNRPTMSFVQHIINATNIHNHEYILYSGDSKSKDMLDNVKDEIIDMLYIDGNHSEEYVYSDFVNYFEVVRKGGVIIFDDQFYPSVNRAIKKILNKYVDKISVINLGLNYNDLNSIDVEYLQGRKVDNVFKTKSNFSFVIQKLSD